MGRRTGRPSDYRPEMCDSVLDMMAEGQSMVEVAVGLGADRTTVASWADRHPEFAAALALGKEMSEAWWARQGREALRDKDFRERLWSINMQNRFGWSLKMQGDHTHKMDDMTAKALANLADYDRPT